MEEFFGRLRQRKIVQWALAYVAAAFALIQVLDIVAQRFDWPAQAMRGAIIALAVGFLVALVVAWYHGERGAQRVTGTELLILALLLSIGGAIAWRLSPSAPEQSVAAGKPAAAPGTGSQPEPDRKSIAVLAFTDLSPKRDQEYFSDGLAEEILDALTKVKDLKVAGRTSSFSFKGRNDDLRAIGKALAVANVLEGSVQTSGDDVRITAQLIDTRSGYHLWSQKYDRKLTSIFAIEDEISKAIADNLKAQLSDGPASSAANTTDPRAHELYLRGMTLLAARGTGLRAAAEVFRQAVTIDPNYAQAWAALAQAEVLIWNWNLDTDGAAQSRAETAAQRALAIDANNATAHVALGILYDGRWQRAEAGQALRRALELAPGDSEAIEQYAQYLHLTGQFQSALHEIERANLLDPLSGLIGGVHAQILLDMHRCDDAQAQIAQTLAAAPESRYANGIAMAVALNCKRFENIEAQARKFASLADQDPEALVALVRGVADPNRRDAALALAKAMPLQGHEKPYWLILLGDREGALDALETHFAAAPATGAERLWMPAYDPIRDDPRFRKILATLGIPFP